MKLRLNKNQVVNCTTQSEADKCCQLAKSMGLKYRNGESYVDTYWYEYEFETCYNFNEGTYADIGFNKEIGNQILTAQAFLTMHSFPFMGYFEGNKNTTYGNGIIAILESLGGKNVQMLSGYGSDYYSIDKNGAIVASKYQPRDCMCCNPLHYLHLIENSEIPNNSESTELAENWRTIKKQDK